MLDENKYEDDLYNKEFNFIPKDQFKIFYKSAIDLYCGLS